jgi:DDE superfamily endonuclease
MPDIPMKPGRCVKQEFEYIRHGTQTLIAIFNVATGAIALATVGDTRTEQDFEAHVRKLDLLQKSDREMYNRSKDQS